MSQITVLSDSYDALLTTTLRNHNKTLVDNISKTNALLFFLMNKSDNGYKAVEGGLGERAQIGVLYGLATADSYKGYDVLNTNPIDGVTSAFYDWAQMSVPISINRLEERQNSGENRIINLLETKVEQAEMGIKEFFNRAMLQGNGINVAAQIGNAYVSPNNSSVFIDSLAKQVDITPATGVVGSIDPANATWWRNQISDFSSPAVTTFAGLMKRLENFKNNCSKGPGGAPDLYLADQATYELIAAALRSQNRFVDYKMADIPFDNYQLFGHPVTWDEYMPNFGGATTVQSTTAGTLVALNTKFWQVQYDPETNFRQTGFDRPINQDAKVAFIQWYGAMLMKNRRKNGVAFNIDTTIVA